jgi:hypothetical protein
MQAVLALSVTICTMEATVPPALPMATLVYTTVALVATVQVALADLIRAVVVQVQGVPILPVVVVEAEHMVVVEAEVAVELHTTLLSIPEL